MVQTFGERLIDLYEDTIQLYNVIYRTETKELTERKEEFLAQSNSKKEVLDEIKREITALPLAPRASILYRTTFTEKKLSGRDYFRWITPIGLTNGKRARKDASLIAHPWLETNIADSIFFLEKFIDDLLSDIELWSMPKEVWIQFDNRFSFDTWDPRFKASRAIEIKFRSQCLEDKKETVKRKIERVIDAIFDDDSTFHMKFLKQFPRINSGFEEEKQITKPDPVSINLTVYDHNYSLTRLQSNFNLKAEDAYWWKLDLSDLLKYIITNMVTAMVRGTVGRISGSGTQTKLT